MSEYNWDRIIRTADYEIMVDTAACYGYFEHERLGDQRAGGLWFEKLEGGVLALFDYDGVFELPAEVKEALIACNYVIDEDF